MSGLLAFMTEAVGVSSVVFARSRGVARKVTRDAAKDAGYRVAFTDVRVRRAPEYDAMQGSANNVWATNCCLDPKLITNAAASAQGVADAD